MILLKRIKNFIIIVFTPRLVIFISLPHYLLLFLWVNLILHLPFKRTTAKDNRKGYNPQVKVVLIAEKINKNVLIKLLKIHSGNGKGTFSIVSSYL